MTINPLELGLLQGIFVTVRNVYNQTKILILKAKPKLSESSDYGPITSFYLF